MTRLLDDGALERSSVVANCAMNRERSLTGSNGYGRPPRISRRGGGETGFPYRYLGANDQAGPNYTGRPAVDSCYEPLPMPVIPRLGA